MASDVQKGTTCGDAVCADRGCQRSRSKRDEWCPRAPAASFDAQVLEALKQGGRAATYVVRNRLSMRGAGNYATRRVLAGLRRLEAAGRARQVPSSYAVMLTWEAATDA